MKKLLCINTINNFKDIIYDPFLAPFAKENPEIQIVTITDDTLLSETRSSGAVTPAVVRRMYSYACCGVDMGADCILCTCTSVNQATARLAPMMPVPMFNIEEPTVQAAVNSGRKIGILATLESSPTAVVDVMQAYAARIGKKIEVVSRVVENAFEILSAGDRGQHDRMVCAALEELASQVDCIMFAQISMSLLPHGDVGVPIYKIGSLGLEKARKLLLET